MYRPKIQITRVATEAGNFYVPAEPKLASVIRIRDIDGVSPKVHKVRQLFLCLCQMPNGTFVKLHKASFNTLRIVGSYMACGCPKVKSVNELTYKPAITKSTRSELP